MTEHSSLTPENKDLLATCCAALDDTKAEDIVILNVSAISNITNFLVLASATSEPHLKALKRDLDKAMKDRNAMVLGVDEGQESGWSVVDAFDVMVHLFTKDMRQTYSLETLWKDAEPIKLAEILQQREDRSA